MTTIELISLIASIASLLLAIGAIWLSIVFFKMSSEASKATTEAAKGIGASVERLENLFDKLYSDTFTMMKDTVSDMRKHIWNKPKEGDGKKEVNESIKQEIESQISKVLTDAGIGDPTKTQELSQKLEASLEEIFQKSKDRKRSIKTARVLSTIEEVQPITLSKLCSILSMEEDDLAIRHLFPLREKKAITWDGPSNRLSSDSVIEIYTEEEPEG